MINEIKTFYKFRYYSIDLKPHSAKKVIANCDKCGKERILKFQDYRNLCKSCIQFGDKGHNYGKKFSEKTKEKMSKNHANFSGKNHPQFGKHRSEKTKEKIRKGNKGKFISNETRKKLKESHIGKKHTEESKRKMSIATSGKNNPMFGIRNFGNNNPNWQGGISFEPYCINFNNEIKEQVREEFNRKCFLCGVLEKEYNKKLSIHHIDYDKNQGCNSDWKLIPLCNSCHSKTSGKYVRDYYEGFISRLLYIRELILEYDSKINYRSIGI